jgi:glycerol-3-phosphate acyltransferase PlsY
MNYFAAALAAYLLGSIPFGLLLTRMAGLGDVRAIGSGNIGATNVLRTGNKGLAAATLLLDLAKGAAAVLLAGRFLPGMEGPAALGVVVGHCFPVWLGFKGGKGVATTAGACFALGWPIGLAYAIAWLGLALLTRISSLAGLCAAVAAPVAASAMGYHAVVPYLVAIAALIIWLHRGNIGRLRNGTEPKLGAKK